jgi:hypothetical protein
MTLQTSQAPVAVSWKWRDRANPEAARTREVAAARKQGLLGLGIGLAVALLFYFALGRHRMGLVVGAVAVVLALIAFLFPQSLHKKVAAGLAAFGHAFGTAVTWVLMTILYYILFLPVGLFLRKTGKLRLVAAPERAASTYWVSTEERQPTLESYRRQF